MKSTLKRCWHSKVHIEIKGKVQIIINLVAVGNGRMQRLPESKNKTKCFLCSRKLHRMARETGKDSILNRSQEFINKSTIMNDCEICVVQRLCWEENWHHLLTLIQPKLKIKVLYIFTKTGYHNSQEMQNY